MSWSCLFHVLVPEQRPQEHQHTKWATAEEHACHNEKGCNMQVPKSCTKGVLSPCTCLHVRMLARQVIVKVAQAGRCMMVASSSMSICCDAR